MQEEWTFFGKCNFRWNYRFRIMRYTGAEPGPEKRRSMEASAEDLQAIFGSRLT